MDGRGILGANEPIGNDPTHSLMFVTLTVSSTLHVIPFSVYESAIAVGEAMLIMEPSPIR